MRARAVVLAVALVLAPLGAPGPPTSWCGGRRATTAPGGRGGQGDHRRLRAGDRQAGRARRPSARTRVMTRSRRRSRPGSRPISCSALDRTIRSRSGPTRTGSSTSTDAIGPVLDLFDADALDRPPCSMARRADAVSTRCRWGARPTTSTSGTASWSGPASPSPTFRRSGRRSGRSGATVQPAVRKATGRDDIWGVGLPMSAERPNDTRIEFMQFLHAYGRGLRARPRAGSVIDDPAIRRGAGQSHGRLHRDLAQGLHAARCRELGWPRQQQGVPGPDGRDDAERDALDPERARARATRRLLQERRHDRMAGRRRRPAARHRGRVVRPWSSRTAGTSPCQGVRALPGRGGLARPLARRSPATAFCRRCASWSSSRSGSTRATRTACAAAIQSS